jgi:hypothetical protein
MEMLKTDLPRCPLPHEYILGENSFLITRIMRIVIVHKFWANKILSWLGCMVHAKLNFSELNLILNRRKHSFNKTL